MAPVYEVDPVSRIEGHLGVKVTVGGDGKISEANAHGNLWRGFENFLIGRRANDAITFTQRICGVCPVPHGTAATLAAESVLGVSGGYATFAYNGTDGVPAGAVLIRNMVLASEFLMSSITHFYHLAAQSYVQGPPVPPWTPYFPAAQYHGDLLCGGRPVPDVDGSGVPQDLWSAVIKQYVKAIRIRRLCLEAGAIFAGRMPMMSMSVAGGVTNKFKDQQDFFDRCDAFKNLITEVGRFVIAEYIPLALALGALYPTFDNNQVADAGNLPGFGAGCGNFLSWGAFPEAVGAAGTAGTLALKGGWKLKTGTSGDLLINRANHGDAKTAVETNLREVIARSRYANSYGYDAGDTAYPGSVTRTEPKRDSADKYSWLKAPRWNGNPMEVGPLARMVVNSMYLVNGGKLVDPASGVAAVAAYGNLYLNDAHTGLDTRVVHGDLLAGLAGSNPVLGDMSTVVTNYIAGLRGGLSTMDRLRARAIESFWMVKFMLGMPNKVGLTPDTLTFANDGWVSQLRGLWTDPATAPTFYRATTPPVASTSGYGLTEAPRGALGHFITATSGKITAYQCVVPTTWNGSPKDGADSGVTADNTGATKRGPMEQAMIGVPFDTAQIPADATSGRRAANSGVEVLRVAQSFDPCIACAVH